jgi:hypothetical protein
MTSTAQRLILRGSNSAALGFVIRLAARLLFVFIAGRLFGVALFGAFSIAVAVVELAVTIGGAGMKRQLFKLLDEGHHLRSPPHIVIDGIVLVFVASVICAAPIMLAVALAPASLIAGNTASALFLLAPMILGQSLLDLLLAATRWTHKMRHQVWARSIIEPYAGVIASGIAWAAGYQTTGLIIGYWAGTIAAVIYSLTAVRRCLGPPAGPTLAPVHFFKTCAGSRDFVRIANALFRDASPSVGAFLSGIRAVYGMHARSGPDHPVRQGFSGRSAGRLPTPPCPVYAGGRGPLGTRPTRDSAAVLIALFIWAARTAPDRPNSPPVTGGAHARARRRHSRRHGSRSIFYRRPHVILWIRGRARIARRGP